MNKTIKLFGLGAMAVAMLTGCTAEEPGAGTGREITVSFSVSTDAQLTREGATTPKSNRLRWTVFNADGSKVLNSGTVENAFQTSTQSVDINLIEGTEYTIGFWAENDANQCYSYEAGTIKIDYSKMTASTEACDAFFGKVVVPANGIVATGVTLSRPFAQFNYAALDYDTYKKFGGAEIVNPTFTFKNSGVSTVLSMFSGKGSNVQKATIAATALPTEAFTVNSQTYKYLYYAYVLPSEAVATVEFYANKGDAEPYRTYDNVPLKGNMRTNIFGNVLTSTTNFQISLELGYPEPWDGETATTPVIDEENKTIDINKPSDFAGLADLVNGTGTGTRAEVIEPMDFKGYTVYLNKDLDLGGKEWTPIGDGIQDGSGYTGHVFKGNFNGQGHTITGLKISKSPATEKADLGFFGVVDGGTIENINFVNVDVNLAKCKTMGVCVGQLTGGGTVKNITVSGKIKGQNGVGGVVGRVTKWGNVIDCTNYADITAIAGSSNTGGIIGAAYYNDDTNIMEIKNCKNYGTITTAGGQIGGIVGLSAAFISKCSNYGNITAVTGSIGGIAGDVYCSGWIKNCTNEGNITNNGSGYGTGGIAGWIRYYQTKANYPRLNIVEVYGCENKGTINGGNDGGGIVGTVYHFGEVTNNKNYAPSISAITFAAGIVGNIQFPDKDYRDVAENFSVIVSNNLSTTTEDNISGSFKHLFAYNNAPKDPYVEMENNTTKEL